MLEKFSGLEGKNGEELYNIDMDLALKEGVSKEAMYPYFHKGSDKGVLLIHGFAASPKEVEPFYSLLVERGYTVYAARVAGHGTTPEDMASKTWKDWYKSLIYGYFAIKNSCSDITIAGQSNGGLLATLTSLFNPSDRLLLFAPAFKARNPLIRLSKCLRKFPGGGVKRILIGEQREFNYDIFPYDCLYEMVLLQDYLKPRLGLIDIPVLLSISSSDLTVSTKAAVKSVRSMGTPDKEMLIYGNIKYKIAHIMTEDYLKGSVLKDAADWIEKGKSGGKNSDIIGS